MMTHATAAQVAGLESSELPGSMRCHWAGAPAGGKATLALGGWSTTHTTGRFSSSGVGTRCAPAQSPAQPNRQPATPALGVRSCLACWGDQLVPAGHLPPLAPACSTLLTLLPLNCSHHHHHPALRCPAPGPQHAHPRLLVPGSNDRAAVHLLWQQRRHRLHLR